MESRRNRAQFIVFLELVSESITRMAGVSNDNVVNWPGSFCRLTTRTRHSDGTGVCLATRINGNKRQDARSRHAHADKPAPSISRACSSSSRDLFELNDFVFARRGKRPRAKVPSHLFPRSSSISRDLFSPVIATISCRVIIATVVAFEHLLLFFFFLPLFSFSLAEPVSPLASITFCERGRSKKSIHYEIMREMFQRFERFSFYPLDAVIVGNLLRALIDGVVTMGTYVQEVTLLILKVCVD